MKRTCLNTDWTLVAAQSSAQKEDSVGIETKNQQTRQDCVEKQIQKGIIDPKVGPTTPCLRQSNRSTTTTWSLK